MKPSAGFTPLPPILEPDPTESGQEISSLPDGCPHGDASGAGRNLVVNLDGTSNQFSLYSTNVVEIFSRIIKDERQRVYYNSGIGTYARPSLKWQYIKQWLDHKIDTAIAWHFETIVHAAYEWLSENYMDGDRIFLFGFSRGAYQVRVIAGMIETVGLLHKGNKSQIPFAYELYTSVKDHEGKSPKRARTSRDRKEKKLCDKFKASLCHKNVKVHFVGCWDTVSSIGVFRGRSFPETVSGMGHVCSFRHALALDERRVKFLPEYANGGMGPREGDRGDVKEVWFAGTHSDIGGGNIPNEDLENFVAALRWMTYEATNRGLRIDAFHGTWTLPQFSNSLTAGWRFLEFLPFRCLSYKDERSTKWALHLAAGRQIHNGQLIHQSVIDQLRRSAEEITNDDKTIRYQLKYTPKAKLPATFELTSWDDLLTLPSYALPSFIEKDPYEMGSPSIQALLDISTKLRTAGLSGDTSEFQAVLSTIHDFLGDGVYLGLSAQYRHASLTEVPSAGAAISVALDVAVDHQTTLGEKTKVTLVRLLERLRLKVERFEVAGQRLRAKEIYDWVLPIWNNCRFDEEHLREVFQKLGMTFLIPLVSYPPLTANLVLSSVVEDVDVRRSYPKCCVLRGGPGSGYLHY
ncbi:hypothetical protein ONZ45_g16445 [Pleurotus djamor]|nr:hypothetical protein ONZ45_g16445 [Pleurotus djamor]